MKFSLPTLVALFCAATSLAATLNNPIEGDLTARNPEDVDVPTTDITTDTEELDVEDVELDDESDFENLLARDTIKCSNDGYIKRVKKEYHGKCNPKNSKRTKSAHNCKNLGGKSYLCVQKKKATCYVS